MIDGTEARDEFEDGRTRPLGRETCAETVGKNARQISWKSATGDVAHGAHVRRSDDGLCELRVELRWLKQRVGHGLAIELWRRRIETDSAFAEKNPACERVAVRMKARRGDCDDRVTDGDALSIDDALSRHNAEGETGEVVFTVGVHAWKLGGLASKERAATGLTRAGDASDDRLGDGKLKLSCPEVIEEKERSRAARHDVVHAHAHEVRADAVVTTRCERELELRADAVGAADEYRLLDVAWNGEEPREAAHVRENARNAGALRQRLDALHELVARVDVHACVTVADRHGPARSRGASDLHAREGLASHFAPFYGDGRGAQGAPIDEPRAARLVLSMDCPAAPRVVIFGDGRLSRAIERRLIERGCDAERHALRETTDLDALDLARVSAVALAADDDTGNVDLAITLRTLRPTVRLVVRMFDSTLAAYLQRTLPNIVVTNMTEAAAPAFVGAVLDGIEHRTPSHAAHLPAPPAIMGKGFGKLLVGTAVSTLALMAFATLFFRRILHLDFITAFYFVGSTITTVGYGDISLRDAPWFAKLVGIALMFGGTALSTMAFALLAEWLIERRIHVLEGRSGVRWRDHAIVVGGGNIGYRVAALLRRRGMRVVIIERDGTARHVLGARADGDHVIVGDALSDGILELASVAGAAAIVAVTNSDAVNLHVAIAAKALAPDIAVAMRIVSPVLSAHVTETHEAVAISPLAVTTDAFVEALTRGSVESLQPSPRT